MKYENGHLMNRIQNNFMYHTPQDDQAERYSLLRMLALDFAKAMIQNAPDSRELSLALTKLEETVMWVNAAIARNE